MLKVGYSSNRSNVNSGVYFKGKAEVLKQSAQIAKPINEKSSSYLLVSIKNQITKFTNSNFVNFMRCILP